MNTEHALDICLRPCMNDADIFLDQWGREAERLGWRAEELFGLHPDAPMARYDRMGLIWMLRGETVVNITATMARFSGGLTFYRKATCSVRAPTGDARACLTDIAPAPK
jgi:hypothetical protein